MSLFANLIFFIRVYIDRLIDYLFSFYYNSQRQFISKPENRLVLESATSLARKIREKQISSEEVVRAFIERIKDVDSVLNAVVDSRFDQAIKEAKEIDRKIAENKIDGETFKKKPFLGVPFTTKETTNCNGMKITFGLACRKDAVATEDAEVVTSLKQAGAILIGVTNIPILNMWQETANPVYGTTNNPYDTTRNVGGSSGGEAAIIAACGSAFGIGTDIGGSIRIPAFMCGLFGHKPTTGLISTKGLTYRTGGDENSTMVTAGTMTKYAEDIMPFFKVLLGQNVEKLTLDQPVNIKDLQVYYEFDCGDPKISQLGDEMKEVIGKTIKYFAENTVSTPQKLSLPNIKYGGRLWRYWLSQEPTNFMQDLTDRKGEVSPFTEIMKYLFRQSEFNIGTISILFNQLLPAEDENWVKQMTEDLKNDIIKKLGNNGILLYPSAPWSARYHTTAALRPWNFYYFAIWNALKFPVTQVPLGLDSEGLPLGIQVVAAPYQDHLCIAAAKELEKAFGGYVPPFGANKEEDE